MSGLTIDLDRRWTTAELDQLPEDGRRYELADGVLLTYALLGIAFWLLDVDRPSPRVLKLAGADDREMAYVEGEQPVTVQRPFPVTVVPADLMRT